MKQPLITRGVMAAVAAAMLSATPLAAAPAATAAPFGSCGDHFSVRRLDSRTLRITGVDLKAFSHAYMLVYASTSAGGHKAGVNASPYNGANFTMDAGTTRKVEVDISLTNDANTLTLCRGTYYA